MNDRGEKLLSGLDDMLGGDTQGVARSEISTSPSEPEILFVEAVRKLNSYEHSLENLVRRFDNGTDSEIRPPLMAEKPDDFNVKSPKRSDPAAGGDRSISRSKHQSDDCQRYVKIQIPFQTAEIVLRIIHEDSDQIQKSALKQSELCLKSAQQSLVSFKQMLQRQLEGSNAAQRKTLIQTIEIADHTFGIIDKLGNKLVDCQVESLSVLLAVALKDETRLSLLAKRQEFDRDDLGPRSRPTGLYTVIFCMLVVYFIVGLFMAYPNVFKESVLSV